MASKKPMTKKATATKSASKKKTAEAVAQPVEKVVVEEEMVEVIDTTTKERARTSLLPGNLINIVITELVGTFILTLVALSTGYFNFAPFYVGLTLTVMVLAIGAVSGSHINPAVTFGLWSMRKLKTALVPFYWAAQFLGAMSAVVLLNVLSNNTFSLSFDSFMSFSWGIFAIELVGAAVFMFGLAAVLSRQEVKSSGKAVGIGMSLTIGLLVAGTLLAPVQNGAYKAAREGVQSGTIDQNKQHALPHELYVSGATLNPAVALAATEKTDSQLKNGAAAPAEGEKNYSRLSLEVITATLIGAALGGNLFLLVNYRSKAEKLAN